MSEETWKFPLAYRNKGEEIIMNYNISLIPGDGIGPEIVAEAKKALDKVCEKYGHSFSYSEVLLGGASIDVHGVPLTEEAIATAKASDAVLMGSIGGDAKTSPWYKLEPSKRPEAGLLAIRKALNLFANLRPAYLYNELRAACPLRDEMKICSLIYNDQGMLKLSGSRCIQTEIGLQGNFHRNARRYINKGSA